MNKARGTGLQSKAKPAPTPTTGAGCGYPRADLPPTPAKTLTELRSRVLWVILSYNEKLNDAAKAMGFSSGIFGKPYAQYLAEYLVESATRNKVPLDLLVALAQVESSFAPTVTTNRYEALGWKDEAIRQAVQNGWAIGPLQVKPAVFVEVGLASPSRWLESLPPWRHPDRLRDAVEAGARYLAKQRARFGTWCAALHAYRVGPTAYQRGSRAHAYAEKVIDLANKYTELRT